MKVDQVVERCITLLRDKMRQRGFSQLEVQETLGWGRSYISQLVTKQKKLRVEQVLLILSVIEKQPAEFFAELFAHGPDHDATARPALSPPGDRQAIDQLRQELARVTEILLKKKLISSDELSAAAEAARIESLKNP